MSRAWAPNSLEEKCLRHLDVPENWRILRSQRPAETELLGWKPFLRIFVFNFVLFVVVLTALFFAVELSSGSGLADVREDLPYGLAGVAAFAIALGFYVMHLYRRTWNRRARLLKRQQLDFDNADTVAI